MIGDFCSAVERLREREAGIAFVTRSGRPVAARADVPDCVSPKDDAQGRAIRMDDWRRDEVAIAGCSPLDLVNV